MFPPHLDYLKDPNIIWFNPCFGYFGFWKRFRQLREERGLNFQSAWLDKDMKRNKELYATTLVALSMWQDAPTKHGWWFTKPPPPLDPPDGVIGTIVETPNGNIMKVREVEIVEHFDGSVLDTLKSKMARKSYGSNTALVCLLSPNDSGVIDLISLSQQVQANEFPLTHIFVAFHGTETASLPQSPTVEDLVKTTLVQLAPGYIGVSLSPHVNCKNWREGTEKSFLKFLSRDCGTELQEVRIDPPPQLFD